MLREDIVRIARSWIGTPYLSNAEVKGAGVDCAMLPKAVYQEAGLIPKDFSVTPYPPQWFLHRGEEMYMEITRRFSVEIEGPPLPGDFVLFKIARLFAHGGIVTEWPKIVHARSPGRVFEEDISLDNFGRLALWRLEKKFFSVGFS